MSDRKTLQIQRMSAHPGPVPAAVSSAMFKSAS